MMYRPHIILGLTLTLAGCSRHHAIYGSVVDRNGEPLERVVVSLEPGNVELVTDEYGRFTIDYLRDSSGARVKLQKRADYEVSLFKPGFHNASTTFYFKTGEIELDPLNMTEDTIRVDAGSENIDPGQYPDRAQNNGAAYEGE
jgi:hypothetical protein